MFCGVYVRLYSMGYLAVDACVMMHASSYTSDKLVTMVALASLVVPGAVVLAVIYNLLVILSHLSY